MGRYLVHHRGIFMEWSTVCDGPATYGMNEAEAREYLLKRYGEVEASSIPGWIERAKATGSTATPLPMSISDVFYANRAGPGETTLTDEQIIQIFMVEKRDPDPETEMGEPFWDEEE